MGYIIIGGKRLLQTSEEGFALEIDPEWPRAILSLTLSKLPSPVSQGFKLGQKVRIVEVVDQVSVDSNDPDAVPIQGGCYVKKIGFNKVGKIVGIEVTLEGDPDDLLDGTMLVKLRDGQLLVVLTDEVEHE